MKPRPAIALVALALLAAATPARAARLEVFGATLTYTDTNSASVVANALTITLAGSWYTIHDPAEASIDLAAGARALGCKTVAADTVTCPVAGIEAITVLSRRGDDRVLLAGVQVPAFVDGGAGDDTLVGGAADDFFFWAPGDGSDRIDGGPGGDVLEFVGSNLDEHFTVTSNGTGFDLARDAGGVRMAVQDVERMSLFSGEGTDTVDTIPLAGILQEITDGAGEPDGLADVLRVDAGGRCLTRRGDDGFEIDGRTVIEFADFPSVLVANELCPTSICDEATASGDCTVNHVRHQPCQGTAADDVIVGTAGYDVIHGGGGDDRIIGRGGDDLLCGDDGADLLRAGGDRLEGGSGNDVLAGDDGDDVLSGRAGKDDLDGGAGADALHGGDNSDTLRGGAGADVLDGGGSTDLCTDDDQPGGFHGCEQP